MNTAVVLTARKDKLTDVPFPLLPFDSNISLIDRTLTLLRELNYKKIILVVGYRADLYQRFKAEDVIIVENPEFEFTASMASLAIPRNIIDEDFLLVEGDTFYEKCVLEPHIKIQKCTKMLSTVKAIRKLQYQISYMVWHISLILYRFSVLFLYTNSTVYTNSTFIDKSLVSHFFCDIQGVEMAYSASISPIVPSENIECF